MLEYIFDIRANAVLGTSDTRAEHGRTEARDYFDLIEHCFFGMIAK